MADMCIICRALHHIILHHVEVKILITINFVYRFKQGAYFYTQKLFAVKKTYIHLSEYIFSSWI